MLPALRRSLGRRAEWEALQHLRSLSAEAVAHNTDAPIIHVACVLERLPVVAAPPPAWEAEHHDWMLQYNMKRRLQTDYPEVKHIYAPMADARSREQATSQQPSNAPSQASEATVPLTPADAAKDLRSMRRALSDRLYLLVKQPLHGSGATWHFPHAQVQEGESIRETCERALATVIGRKYPTFFIGNAPMAHLPLPTTGSQVQFMLAQVVDDPWGPLTLPQGSPATDYAWFTREEATQHVGDVAMAKLLPHMLP